MNHHASFLSALVLATSFTALSGCAIDGTTADPKTEDPAASASEALRNGSFSFSEPAVGSLHTLGLLCTATLIDPQVVITASHCLKYQSRALTGYFQIDLSATSSFSYPIDKGVSYGSDPGVLWDIDEVEKDVAIVHLATPVPSSIATPMAISPGAVVSMGTRVTIYGYGCRATEHDAYTGRKQRYDYPYDDSVQTCPGDSGGPTILAMVNGVRTISMVTSGSAEWMPGSTKPTYGLVYAQYWNIENQIAAWAGTTPPSSGGGGGGGGGINHGGGGPGGTTRQN